jgi:DNA-binding response OmpR family regulator
MLTQRDLAGRAAILALPDSALLTATIDRLRRAGWRVFRAATIDSVRDLAHRVGPEVVVLPADGSDESGWLTCAKLLEAMPGLRAIVVGKPTADGTEFARFIGATLVPGDASAEELADHVEGAALQAI